MDRMQVLRIEPRDALPDALPSPRLPADARRLPAGEPPVVILHANLEKARNAVRTYGNPRRRGPRPKPCVEFFVAGPPPYSATDAWTPEREREWGLACFHCLRRVVGLSSVFAFVVLERDGPAPQLRLLVVPISDAGELSWTARKRDIYYTVTGQQGERPKRITRAQASAVYAFLVDYLYEGVSKNYGLVRGYRGAAAQNPLKPASGASPQDLQKALQYARAWQKYAEDSKAQWAQAYGVLKAENAGLKKRLSRMKTRVHEIEIQFQILRGIAQRNGWDVGNLPSSAS